MTEKKNDSQEPRRRLLKTVAGGSALGLTAIPGKWAKPMVASVVLPAHAQTSLRPGCALSLAGCPPESLYTYPYNESYEKYIPADYLPPDITVNSDGYLTGSYSFSESGTPDGPFATCPPPCDSVSATKYYSGQISFDGEGNMETVYNMQFLCGGDAIANKYFGFNGAYSGSGDDDRNYDGAISKYFQACYPGEGPKYSGPGGDSQPLNQQRRAPTVGTLGSGGPVRDRIRNRIRNRIGR